jgi:predicted amidohydrolase YtcJ
VVQNPTHFTLTTVFAQRFDDATFAALEPMRSLLEHDIPLALGSDAIGQPGNPFIDMLFAIVHPTHPSEGLTITQAVRAYTSGSAHAELAEHRKGVLAPGRLADLAVLSQDIFTASPFALPATTSVLTIVGGEVVWDAGVL